MDCKPASERPKCFHLTLTNQVFHGARDILDRHVRVHAVLVKEVDPVGTEPLQRRLGDLADALRPAVEPGLVVAVLEAELRGDHDLVAKRRERLAHELLVHEGTVGFGGVEKRHAALECLSDEHDACLLLDRRGRARS